MRKRLLFAFTLSLVVILGAVAWLVVRTMWQRPEDLVRMTLDLAPGVAQQIRDFRRVKMRDGRVEWEVAAREAQVFEDSSAVEVNGIVLRWYLSDGRVVGLTGERGTIQLEGREVERIELVGSVVVSLADYEVRVEAASYDHSAETIVAPGRVDVSGAALRLRGDGMRVEVRKQQLALLRDVSMQLEPARMPHGGQDAPL
jgi:LPS export ABC transporter protein LptC